MKSRFQNNLDGAADMGTYFELSLQRFIIQMPQYAGMLAGAPIDFILPLFWKEFYPCFNKETPLHIQNIIDAYAQKLYPDEYDKTDGVIKYSHLKDKLRSGVADVGEREMKNKDIAYFCERNPGYIKGNDLACIARIDRAALKKRAAELLFG